MDTWVIIAIIALAMAVIIGNISLLGRSATPLRKQSLNDLKETLPRNSKHSNDTATKK